MHFQEPGKIYASSYRSSLLTLSSWLIYNIVHIIRTRAQQHDSVVATGIVTSCFVIISVLSAFPWVRKSVLPHVSHADLALFLTLYIATITTLLRSIIDLWAGLGWL